MRAGARAFICAACGIAAGIVASFLVPWQAALLTGWDSAAVVFLIWAGTTQAGAGVAETGALATRQDSSRAAADFLLLGASAASLGAVALTLLKASSEQGGAKAALAALGLGSIVVSWAVIHLTFAFKYARIYYANGKRGIDFHDDETDRTFLDFAYVAFTIGMTYQVSDTDLVSGPIRATALRHALLSFLFGTAIIATTINLIAGLAK